jgi:hypothetical protein
MLRQKGKEEHHEKVKRIDTDFEDLFPNLFMGVSEKLKPKEMTDYDRLKIGISSDEILAPTIPQYAKEEGSSKRKKVAVLEEAAAEDLNEGLEEQSFSDYEEDGEDVERDDENEENVRKFAGAKQGKKDKLFTNYNKTLKNLKIMGEMEDELLAQYVSGMNDIDFDGDEEEGSEGSSANDAIGGEEEFGEDEFGEEEFGDEEYDEGDEEEEGEEEQDN